MSSWEGGCRGLWRGMWRRSRMLDSEKVHMASRSRKRYWRMTNNSLVRFALKNCVLKEEGAPN